MPGKGKLKIAERDILGTCPPFERSIVTLEKSILEMKARQESGTIDLTKEIEAAVQTEIARYQSVVDNLIKQVNEAKAEERAKIIEEIRDYPPKYDGLIKKIKLLSHLQGRGEITKE